MKCAATGLILKSSPSVAKAKTSCVVTLLTTSLPNFTDIGRRGVKFEEALGVADKDHRSVRSRRVRCLHDLFQQVPIGDLADCNPAAADPVQRLKPLTMATTMLTKRRTAHVRCSSSSQMKKRSLKTLLPRNVRDAGLPGIAGKLGVRTRRAHDGDGQCDPQRGRHDRQLDDDLQPDTSGCDYQRTDRNHLGRGSALTLQRRRKATER